VTENYATRLLFCVFLLAGYACELQAQQVTNGAVPGSGETLDSVTLPEPPANFPKPPRISCQGDQLSIVADNSTMGSVLAGVHTCTGVDIQMPMGFAEERTYIKLGPGPIREVLNDLLSSTEFNYVIESSNSDPRKILTVLLTSRTKDADTNGVPLGANLTMTPARRAWLASRNAARPESTPTADEGAVPVNEEPGSSKAPESPLPPQTDSKGPVEGTAAADSKDHLQSNDGLDQAAAVTHSPDVTASSDIVPAVAGPVSAPADSNEEQPAAKVLQNKINQMEQLFEERKKMNANPPAAPVPN